MPHLCKTFSIKKALLVKQKVSKTIFVNFVHFSQEHFKITFPHTLGESGITGFDWTAVDQSLFDHTETRKVQIEARPGEMVSISL